MAVVGDAYIVVRAITDNVKSDIRNGFKGVSGETSKMGREAGSAFGPVVLPPELGGLPPEGR